MSYYVEDGVQLSFDFSDDRHLEEPVFDPRVTALRDALFDIMNMETYTAEGAAAKRIATEALLDDGLEGSAFRDLDSPPGPRRDRVPQSRSSL